MKFVILLTLSISACLPNLLQAQALGEEAYLDYFLGQSTARYNVNNENGIAKSIFLHNLPSNAITGFVHTNSVMNQIDGAFGTLNTPLRYTPANGFLFDVQGSTFGEWDATGILHLRKVFNAKDNNRDKRKTLRYYLLANGNGLKQKIDQNQDSYLDLSLKDRIFLHNQLDFIGKNYFLNNGFRFLRVKEQGGQLQYQPNMDYMTSNAYGTGLDLHLFSFQSDNRISLRTQDELSINFYASHNTQEHYLGQRLYQGREWLAKLNMYYDLRLDNDFDAFQFGINYRYQHIQEDLDSASTNQLFLDRKEHVSGGFLGYETYPHPKVQFRMRLNANFHNIEGPVIFPHLKINYEAWKNHLLLGAFGGGGMRYANIVADNWQYLRSSRQIDLQENLRAERSWYYGISAFYSQHVRPFYITANGQFYVRHYLNHTVVDLDSDPHKISFYNLDGNAFKTSLDLDLKIQLPEPYNFSLNIDYRYDFFRTTIGGSLRSVPFYSEHNFVISPEYHLMIFPYSSHRFTMFILNMTWNINSPQRIPFLDTKLIGTHPRISPWVHRWDMKVSLPLQTWFRGKSKWKNFTLYFGIDNLLDVIQETPFLNPETPFDVNFDGGMIWNSSVGRRYYFGAVYKF